MPGVDTPAEDGVQAVDFRQAPPPGAPGGMSSGDIDAIDAANRALLDPGRDIAVGGQQRAHPMPDKVGVPLGLAQTRRPLLA